MNLPTILIAEDDEGHALLIEDNLRQAGLTHPVRHFRDGQAVLDFFFRHDANSAGAEGESYLLLLDIRMPKLDGADVLRALKQDRDLCRLPVIVLTTTDDPREVERCHSMGCNLYIQKPIDYDRFATAVQRLGRLIQLILVPPLDKR